MTFVLRILWSGGQGVVATGTPSYPWATKHFKLTQSSSQLAIQLHLKFSNTGSSQKTKANKYANKLCVTPTQRCTHAPKHLALAIKG